MNKGFRRLFLLIAALLLLCRTFTGIVYEYDDPTTYLVLKRSPSLLITQENREDTPVRDRFVVVDGGENLLGYEHLYLPLMSHAFPAAAALVAGAVVLAVRGRARRSRFG